MLRDVVAQGPSESCRIKNLEGYFVLQCSYTEGRRAKQALSLSKQTAMGYRHATENRP